jgi:hypothetical protein
LLPVAGGDRQGANIGDKADQRESATEGEALTATLITALMLRRLTRCYSK